MDNAKNVTGDGGKKAERLTELQARFVREYCIDYCAGNAYQRAQAALGKRVVDDNSAHVCGSRMLHTAKVRKAANELRDSTSYDTEDMRRRLIDELVRIAYSDAGKIASWKRSGCSHCWEPNDPRVVGGKSDAINQECQWCKGRGVGYVHITPTSELAKPEGRLYDGIEETKLGIKVHMRSRDKAVELLAKHFGIGPERVELTGKDGGPIEITGARERLLASINKRTLRS